MESVPLDGNAAAGPLADMFAAEMTTAMTICATCRAEAMLAELPAYLLAPGAVLRCASCGAVQIRIVRGPGRAWLDVQGVRLIEVALPEDTG
ncbi:MAG: hypothetical protein J2P57_12690 [Acidimicrobiaceae bacterium]|nr:hypothetical protein [Acidimicrobiaceae bacterium]